MKSIKHWLTVGAGLPLLLGLLLTALSRSGTPDAALAVAEMSAATTSGGAATSAATTSGAAATTGAATSGTTAATTTAATTTTTVATTTTGAPAQLVLLPDVPFIDQRERYPNGCESVSAVMALQYAGVDVTVDAFIDGYLDCGSVPHAADPAAPDALVGDNPWEVFLGDPRATWGWGCYAPVVEKGVRKLLAERDMLSSLAVAAQYERSLPLLCSTYIDSGTPVLIWATIDMKKPSSGKTWTVRGSGERITWIAPMHCLLLVGYDDAHYYFNDPMQGAGVRYAKAKVETAYKALGMQSLVLLETYHVNAD